MNKDTNYYIFFPVADYLRHGKARLVKALHENLNKSPFLSVVDQLTLVNITDTMAELTWEAPLCQVEGNIEYIVSYSGIVNGTTATTATTTYRYTDLSPATNYNFCVLVQHPGVVPNHTSTCISTYTLPAGMCGCNSLIRRSLLPIPPPPPPLSLALLLLPLPLLLLPLLLLL